MSSIFGTVLRSGALLLFAPIEAIVLSQTLQQLGDFMAEGTRLQGMFLAVGDNFLFLLILSLVANVAAAAYIEHGGRY